MLSATAPTARLVRGSIHPGLACLFVCAGAALVANSAAALDRDKAAAMMAKNAMHAYEAGDYRRASELYETAFGLNPDEPMFLYSAARAADTGGLFVRADNLYNRTLKHPKCKPETAGKVKTHQGRLRRRRASIKADQASIAAKKGQHSLAALLYREAARQAPSNPRYLFEAGKSSLLANERPAAKKYLLRYVDRAKEKDKTDANARRRVLAAQAYLARIDEPAAARSGTMPAASSGQQRAAPPPGLTTRRMVMMGGGVMVLASAIIGGLAWRDRGTLLDQLEERDKDGLIKGITYAEATTTSTSIGTRYSIAIGLAGAGAVAALGALLWPTDDDNTLAIHVSPTGVAASWSFR